MEGGHTIQYSPYRDTDVSVSESLRSPGILNFEIDQ